MFGFLKNIVKKLSETSDERQETFSSPENYNASAPDQESRPVSMRPRNGGAGNGSSPSNGHGATHRTSGLELPLQSILASLPLELQPRIFQTDAGDLTISVPLEKILAQLSKGVVKIPFGELRGYAPDVFLPQDDRDKVLVPLPLGEILARLNPALIARRKVQRAVTVPAEIASPFDQANQGLIYAVGPGKPEAPAAPRPAPPSRLSLTSAPTPPPPSAFEPPPSEPAPKAEAQPIPFSFTPQKNGTPAFTQAPPAPAAEPDAQMFKPAHPIPRQHAAPVAPPAPTFARQQPVAPPPEPTFARQQPVPPAPEPTPNFARQQPAVPAPQPVATPAPVVPAVTPSPATAPDPQKPAGAEGPSILISLTALAEAWPEAVRKEIVLQSLVDAKVQLPGDVVEQGLRQGRLSFTWRRIRYWIKPAPPETNSEHDSLQLDLPLKVVAPIFLQRQKEASKPQNKVAVDADIPNLFFGFPQPEAPAEGAPAAAKTTESNFYIWGENNDRVVTDESADKRTTPGTRFVEKYATPNEVVSRASNMEGVAGSLIALPDGLMVASQISTDLNGDTLAAFLPQIFGKVSQCTKELRMGELNNLNFTVGNVPWKIFRVNAIFFAAFGRAGQPLPTAQLAALAAELDHKPR